ncbi:MAG: DedA family protein [Dehalococcoidia bacterium]
MAIEEQTSAPPSPDGQPEDSSEPNLLERYAGWFWAVVGVVFIVLFLNGINPIGKIFDWYGELTAAMLRLAKHLLDEYGYLAVFLVPLLENSFFLGLIVPGSIILIFCGLGAQQGLIDWYVALPLAIAGAIIGDTLSYFGGRYAWPRLLGAERVDKWKVRWRDTFMTNARWVILLYHFLGYTRMIGPTAAGVLHLPYRKWAPLDYSGVALWVLVFGAIGYILGLFGLSLDDSEKNVRVFEAILLVFVFLLVGKNLFKSETAKEDSDKI